MEISSASFYKTLDKESSSGSKIWKEMMIRNIITRGNGDCASLWNSMDKAREFWKQTQRNKTRYDSILSVILPYQPSKVLDIGSGPGAITLPLARLGCHVTAVEPANGMSALLAENADEYGITDLEIISARWEDIIPDQISGPYDTVIACYSLGMPDISEAILKMEKVCNGRIFLIWFAGVTPWEHTIRDLWPHYHETDYIPGPKADILYQVLYEMGIFADVSVFRESSVEENMSIDEIVSDYASRIGIQDRSDLSYVEKYFRGLEPGNNGSIRLNGELISVVFSWKSRGNPNIN